MKKCLIVVDYQNDFVSGSLGFPKAIELEKQIVAKIEKYREEENDIIFTLDTHCNDYLNTLEGKYLPIEHCIAGTEGHELYGSVKTVLNKTDKIFCKKTFGSDALYEYLKNKKYSEIELIGVVTNICVISNAVLVKTAQPESNVIVDACCVASNDYILNEKALDVMESLQIKILNRKGNE